MKCAIDSILMLLDIAGVNNTMIPGDSQRSPDIPVDPWRFLEIPGDPQKLGKGRRIKKMKEY